MKRKLLYFTIISLLFFSCTFNEVTSDDNNYKFRLRNYTDITYQEGKLFIGAKNSNGEFIATDSIIYSNIPSNISPNDVYNYDDDYTYTSSSNGYYYYKYDNGDQFVKIPFPFTNGSQTLNEEEILSISENIGFLFVLSNGESGYIDGFSLIDGIDRSSDYKNIYVYVNIKDTEISGKVQLPYSL